MRADVGTRIADRYVVLGEIGAGGMGVVVRARDERLGRSVAVKLLQPDAIGDDASRKRLVREARAAAALDHGHIVHVYDVGETGDGGAFLVMELVRGKSLGEHMRAGTLSREQRLRVIVEVARALGFAHQQGFLHRDIKPDNVMVREDGRAVVLDFGLAKVIAPGLEATVDASLISTRTGFVGTPAYVSPEQARGATLAPATDQFSLAVSTFEALTGELPWEGETPLEVISHILRGSPRKLRDVAPELPEALDAVVERALAKTPNERFESIDAFADALLSAAPELNAAPSMGRLAPPESGPKAATASAPTISAPSSTTRDVGAAGKPRARLLAAGLAALAIAGAGAWGLGALHREKPAAAPALTPSSVIACPILEATEPEEKTTGWLGAAAATLVCDRIQLAMGGSAERTRIPAELLDLPRQAGEGFPMAPYEGDARERSLTQAKKADAYVDGRVDFATDFRVVLTLRAKGGDVLEQGEGKGTVLLDAIRKAMERLLPRFPTDTAYATRWFAGASTQARLDVFDLHVLVLNEDGEGAAAACAQLDGRRDLGSLAPFAAARCAVQRYRPLPSSPAFDASSPASTLATASVLRFSDAATADGRKRLTDEARMLDDAARAEPANADKARLLSAEAEIHYALADNDAAGKVARESIQAWPKVVDPRGEPWHRLSFVSIAMSDAVLGAHAAWLPWEPYAHTNLARVAGTGDDGSRRAYILARRGYWAIDYGIRLLKQGKVEAARGLSIATGSDRLRILVLHAARKPGEALRTATSALQSMPAKPENGGEATRLSATAIELALFLGRPTDAIAQNFVDRFLDVDPPPVSHGATAFFGSLAICVESPRALARRCIARLSSLFAEGYFGGATSNAAEALAGAKLFIEGDMPGAAKIWRPVNDALLAQQMRTVIATALERSGDLTLVDRIDDRGIQEGQGSPDIELAYVRKARRAEKQGDMATARKLAATFVERWESADDLPPALADMKRIAAKR